MSETSLELIRLLRAPTFDLHNPRYLHALAADAIEWHMQQEASLRDDIANLERERDLAAMKAWDEGNAAGWDDGADANTAGLDSPTVNPYRWGPELTPGSEQ